MKRTKMLVMATVVCGMIALICVAGIFPAAEQAASDRPEVVPGVSPTAMTMDIIFR